VGGKHEPTSTWSFWISLTTNILKWLIVIGGIVAGVLVLARAFQSIEPQIPAAGSPTASPAQSPKPGKPGGTMGDTDTTTTTGGGGDVSGVRIGVYNGTETEGLATDLEKEYRRNDGVVVSEIGNTTEQVSESVIFYAKPDDQAAAESFADGKFKNADVLELPKDFKVIVDGETTRPDKGVQVLVVIGDDYAA
jgi:hypothetical protein